MKSIIEIRKRLVLQAYKRIYYYFSEFISKKDRILDIGAGRGYTTKILKNKGIDAVASDIDNFLRFDDLEFVKSNKLKNIKSKSFTKSILIFVLHHCRNPEQVLKEAKRLTKNKIIIFEEYYTNPLEKLILKINDNLFNLNFSINMPYNFKSLEEWDNIFKKLGLKKVYEKRKILFFPVPARKVLFVLEPK